MKVYVAGPLFSSAEKAFNLKVDRYLRRIGFETFLPQRDGFLMSNLLKERVSEEEARRRIFSRDLDEIKSSEVILFIIDGRVPDEGACVEIGIGYALRKECVGLKTDTRSLARGADNPMITGTLRGGVARSLSELRRLLTSLKETSGL